VFGGGLLGYVMYDCTHYYLHHGQPSSDPGKHLKVLIPFRSMLTKPQRLIDHMLTIFLFLLPVHQKYHLNHHFRIQNKGFGITSTLWDHVFGTLPSTKTIDKKSS
jgi:dihydroceramide fatty acyl 2-hydroxylase